MVKEDSRGLRLLGGGGVVGWRVTGVSWSDGRDLWGVLTRPGMMRFVGWVTVNEGDWGCVDVNVIITRPLLTRGKHDG